MAVLLLAGCAADGSDEVSLDGGKSDSTGKSDGSGCGHQLPEFDETPLTASSEGTLI